MKGRAVILEDLARAVASGERIEWDRERVAAVMAPENQFRRTKAYAQLSELGATAYREASQRPAPEPEDERPAAVVPGKTLAEMTPQEYREARAGLLR